MLETKRSTLRSALWPTWTTEPTVAPCWSNTRYSFVTSISLAFWFTTRTGWSKSEPPETAC